MCEALSKCQFDGAEGIEDRVLAMAHDFAVCEMREVTSVEEGFDVDHFTNMRRRQLW